MLVFLRKQLADTNAQIEARLVELRKTRPPTARPPKKAKPALARKQSVSQPKRSPQANGHGHSHGHGNGNGNGHAAPKKPRKSKDVNYKEEDAYGESEDEEPPLTIKHKQELAEKIQVADGETLGQAIKIIQASTGLDGVSSFLLSSTVALQVRIETDYTSKTKRLNSTLIRFLLTSFNNYTTSSAVKARLRARVKAALLLVDQRIKLL